MSVYTPVSAAELQQYLAHYALGELLEFSEISEGIENSNYFVTTTVGDYVLTLFESSDETEIAFALSLMRQLRQAGLPCASPMAMADGCYIGQLKQKPATLVSLLEGKSIHHPTPAHCRQIGAQLAQLHNSARQLGEPRLNPRGEQWRIATHEKLQPYLSPEEMSLLIDEMDYQAQQQLAGLPRSIIHGDLFRDNVLFQHDRLTGLIDLYHSGVDLLLYDLAITVNDWCFNHAANTGLDHARLQALLQGYNEVRPVEKIEMDAWPTMLRRAALRFFLSRLLHHHLPRSGVQTQEKDPYAYKNILLSHRENTPNWPL